MQFEEEQYLTEVIMSNSNRKQRFLNKITGGDEFQSRSIIDAIRDDHRDLRHFIEILKDEDVEQKEKKGAYLPFADLLKSHAQSEESAVYAPCLKIEDLSHFAHEGYVEHKIADLLMESIERTKTRESWVAQVKTLAELVEKHMEEEESDFLPQLERYFADPEKTEMVMDFMALRKRSQRSPKQANAGALAS